MPGPGKCGSFFFAPARVEASPIQLQQRLNLALSLVQEAVPAHRTVWLLARASVGLLEEMFRSGRVPGPGWRAGARRGRFAAAAAAAAGLADGAHGSRVAPFPPLPPKISLSFPLHKTRTGAAGACDAEGGPATRRARRGLR